MQVKVRHNSRVADATLVKARDPMMHDYAMLVHVDEPNANILGIDPGPLLIHRDNVTYPPQLYAADQIQTHTIANISIQPCSATGDEEPGE